MYVPEIIEVKNKLEKLKTDGLLTEWSLPYENLLTRLTAAIFFFKPTVEKNDQSLKAITEHFSSYESLYIRQNTEQKLSNLPYRMTFNGEEKQK